MIEKEIPAIEQTVYVFAARYTHSRHTGGTLAVVRALAMVWDRLSDGTKLQIETEAFNEATANRDTWDGFFHWGDELP
jgi:hypothetical protein|tara:strand:+ start:1285 stop:1518 length:234 start_codon:yes stop_codon:yes gene_type:complete